MKIKVRLFAHFRQGREREQILEMEDGTDVAAVLNRLGIDEQEVKIALINGVNGPLDKKLEDDDVLSLFPPVGGG
ncbi:MAG: MoaD/ThiS family protein [Tissierellia bacterium]|nr:MoaD/ThiS family protein [Tissierellia bacterium]